MNDSAVTFRRVAFAWAAGVAIALTVTFVCVALAQLLPFGEEEHRGWLGVFIGVPVGVLLGGFVGGRMVGPRLPAVVWVALNPGAAICTTVLVMLAVENGVASEYFQEVLAPGMLMAVLSLGGAIWGRRSVERAGPATVAKQAS